MAKGRLQYFDRTLYIYLGSSNDEVAIVAKYIIPIGKRDRTS
ncbi:hypothetical protein GXM_00795 [Nostoc sphaeroides CCNUC1]|uniref:Uncharacterized protein n=1 Tax=Nostoc sphaeroides CCNUC1 TaxID=2653204 RepID=A0A5P8VSG7_9NOSO|nr:hypothetical protein GXM_00795 [Nostoc sphaeroides CCNUC1]